MAVNIFDKYGIKEVANVYFEALENDANAGVYKGDIVLFLDTLKTSTIETTAETTDARGGWGNPKLISWDYGKEITVTLTDALISLESLRFMMGGAIKRADTESEVWVHYTEEVIVKAGGKIPLPKDHLDDSKTLTPKATVGHPIRFINYGGGLNSTTAGTRTQIVCASGNTSGVAMTDEAVLNFYNAAAGITSGVVATEGDRVRIFWEEPETTKDAAVEITISPSTFPGTYRIVGDTFIRSQKTGADEAFQFVINKAKVASNVTLTLEAEGDPSTFEMTLNVLRDDSGDMMKLIRYGGSSAATGAGIKDKGSIEGISSGIDTDNSAEEDNDSSDNG